MCWPTVGAGPRYARVELGGAEPGAGMTDASGDRMVEPLGEATRGELGELVLQVLVPHRRRVHAGGEQLGDDLVAIALGEPLGELAVDVVVAGAAAGAGRELRGASPTTGIAEHRAPALASGRRSRIDTATHCSSPRHA